MRVGVLHHPVDAAHAARCRTYLAALRRDGHEVVLYTAPDADGALASDVLLVLTSPDLVEWWHDDPAVASAMLLGGPESACVVPVHVRRADLPYELARLQETPRNTSSSRRFVAEGDADDAWAEVARAVGGLVRRRSKPEHVVEARKGSD